MKTKFSQKLRQYHYNEKKLRRRYIEFCILCYVSYSVLIATVVFGFLAEDIFQLYSAVIFGLIMSTLTFRFSLMAYGVKYQTTYTHGFFRTPGEWLPDFSYNTVWKEEWNEEPIDMLAIEETKSLPYKKPNSFNGIM